MIFYIVMVFCLASSPTECVTPDMGQALYTRSPVECMLKGQQLAAAWEQQNPGYKLKDNKVYCSPGGPPPKKTPI